MGSNCLRIQATADESPTIMNLITASKGAAHVYLKPGEIWIGQRPVIVSTVLGSCISLTCFNPRTGFAAICHTLQPYCPDDQTSSPQGVERRPCSSACQQKYRYTTCTVEAIAKAITKHGCRLMDMEVKLFGGASLIGSRIGEADSRSVGRMNVEAAMAAIQKFKLPLKVANVGGHVGRKILFDTATGLVHMKRLVGRLDP